MRAEVTEADKQREKVRAYLRQCYEECKPLLDKSIRLRLPSVEDTGEVIRYYERKHRRGDYGTYWPLHQIERHTFGVMRQMRRRGK